MKLKRKNLTRFITVLNCCWEEILSLQSENETGSFLEDWLQVNWELIVEGSLSQGPTMNLEVYGDGADCNGCSSRVLYPERSASHRIVCKPRKGLSVFDHLGDEVVDFDKSEVQFDRFVSFREGWYHESPPFDKVLAEFEQRQIVICFSRIDFYLTPIDK